VAKFPWKSEVTAGATGKIPNRQPNANGRSRVKSPDFGHMEISNATLDQDVQDVQFAKWSLAEQVIKFPCKYTPVESKKKLI